MKIICLATLATIIIGCSSSSSSNSPCGDITGNYVLSGTQISGTCTPDNNDASISIHEDAQGYIAVLPGLTGGCPLTYDPNSCKATSACQITGELGAIIGTISIDWTFSHDGFVGTELDGFDTPAVPTKCTATYEDKGRRL